MRTDIPDWMIVDAVRYAIGRRTYQVSTTCDWVVKWWDSLEYKVRQQVKDDLEQEFVNDDRIRGHNASAVLPLGHDMDREQWERVRALWAK